MADCSKTIEYGKERSRLCESVGLCSKCPLSASSMGTDMGCGNIDQSHIDAVQKWSDEHPVKTRKTAFLEMFPDAELKPNGVPYIYPCKLDTVWSKCGEVSCVLGSKQCEKCAEDYWNEEVM